jgi:hypothetical protein
MKVFLVVLLVHCSAFALIRKQAIKACDEQHAKQTEFQLLKAKMDNDPHADVGLIIERMQTVVSEYKALEAKCHR